jgi:CRP/FNR family transcriptional regulator, cyclic AMP receptor protein
VLCNGQVKLSLSAKDGKTLISTLPNREKCWGSGLRSPASPMNLPPQTIDPHKVNFVKREDFLRFMKENSDACFKVAEQLSVKYNNACHEVRCLGLRTSAGQKLAKLMLEWTSRNGECAEVEPGVRLPLTHEEIAQMIRNFPRDGNPPLCRTKKAAHRAAERFRTVNPQ